MDSPVRARVWRFPPQGVSSNLYTHKFAIGPFCQRIVCQKRGTQNAFGWHACEQRFRRRRRIGVEISELQPVPPVAEVDARHPFRTRLAAESLT